MTQKIIGEYVKEPVHRNEMTQEEQYHWYLMAKQYSNKFAPNIELDQAILEYEKRHNIK